MVGFTTELLPVIVNNSNVSLRIADDGKAPDVHGGNASPLLVD
ncbi:hypothetical protein [Kosakonia pseudosacchari]|nr:hypothetical protein [Kosakonia pseudosacchari]